MNLFQDEFKFFMEDAKSKLLLVPSEGNSTAEKAASDLQVPIATLKITSSSGKHPCSHAALCSNSLQARLQCTRLPLHMLLTSSVLCSGSETQKQRVPSETGICRAG